MRKVGTVTAGLLLLLVATRGAAQPPFPKPGPEHEHFKELEGTWDATVESMGTKSKGTMVWKVGLGGLWLLEHFKGEAGDASFEGMGASSYDPAKKKYVNVWIDNMSTAPMVSEGTFDKAKKTSTMTGTAPMPDGKTMKMTMTSVMKDADTIIFTMTTPGADGKDMELMKITYKRKGK
jgi:hypothetical protein